MSRDAEKTTLSGEQWSALLDGELDDGSVVHACAAWREDGSVREAWHAYHLIGDVMRSEDLASTAARDAAFLSGLRARLATEPVVLAPMAAAGAVLAAPRVAYGTRLRRWGWRGPAAVAAGFVAVAGVLVVTRTPSSAPIEVAVTPPVAPTAVVPVADGDVVAETPVLVTNGRLIRDARLDRYLSAHQQFAGSSALGVPSAFLRSATATTDASSR